MGIPRFYRWLSERYPLINENITAEQIPEFDNLYLDMNGIIHNCSHNNTGGLCVKEESDVFVEAFKYITRLVYIIRPKKLLYMAVDGCAPRAKMNQQRSRRFRAANDAREAREKAEEMGEEIHGSHFDSNCITPGTSFMAKLTEHLRFFVAKKIQEDPMWQSMVVVVSGPETPGEGEHKIMDYVRAAKSQPGYTPNMRHCLYGLDADLIMLALASHEPHFSLLREEVIFGRRATESLEQRMLISKDRFQLLHVSVLREYLDLEFAPQKNQPMAYQYNLERVIDDLILFCVLVGNDFLPCLPFAEISEGGLDDFFAIYKERLNASLPRPPWLVHDCGEIAFDQLADFFARYGKIESVKLEAAVDDQQFILGRRRLVGRKEAPDPPNSVGSLPFEPPPTAEDARVQYYDMKFGMDTDTHEGTQEQRQLFRSYLEGLQWVMYYYYRGPDRASWSWYYPYYHAPMAADLIQYDLFKRPGISLDVGEPFKPFQQLMAVLPSDSKVLLPECFQRLFEESSPISHFYPGKFEIDLDGVKVPWGGVTLIPWIDPKALLAAMADAERQGPTLSEGEKQRNAFDKAMCFRYDRNCSLALESPMPHRFASLSKCPVRMIEHRHPPLPPGMSHFLNDLLPGCKLQGQGFPSLHLHPLTYTFETGVKVFQFEARGKSLILHLHPTASVVPDEAALQHVMKVPCVQVDYPVVHRGKVVAVHTAHTKYLANGKTAANNPRDHEGLVQKLVQDLRKKGLVIEFDNGMSAGDAAAGRSRRAQQGGNSDDEFWRQPLVEVRTVESSYLDGDGRLQYRFKATSSEFRLFHLLRAEEQPAALGPRTIAERFPVGASVVCIAKESEAFGELGVVERSSSDAASLEAKFDRGLSRSEREELQAELQRIVERRHAELKWYDLPQIAKLAQLEVNVVRQVFGSLIARCPDNIREDIGMNLMCDSKADGAALCLPCYSVKADGQWWFSDLAAERLIEYRQKFPNVFEALRRRHVTSQDFEARTAFQDSPDPEYSAKQLVKYCNSCPFKKLRLSPSQYMALTPAGILEVVEAVDRAHDVLKHKPMQVETIRGYKRLYKAEDVGSRPPSELFPPSSEDLAIGQRGIYIKPMGLVPCGAKGTVIGVYGAGQTQELELLLDEDSFGASDLRGRAPPMRGLQIPASGFLPLFPRIEGECRATAGGLVNGVAEQADERTDAFYDTGERPEGDPRSRAELAEASSMLLHLLRSPQSTAAAADAGAVPALDIWGAAEPAVGLPAPHAGLPAPSSAAAAPAEPAW